MGHRKMSILPVCMCVTMCKDVVRMNWREREGEREVVFFLITRNGPVGVGWTVARC